MAKLRGICSDAIHWQYRQQARRANGIGRVENILTQIEANNYPLLPDIYLVRFHYLRFRSKRELAGPGAPGTVDEAGWQKVERREAQRPPSMGARGFSVPREAGPLIPP